MSDGRCRFGRARSVRLVSRLLVGEQARVIARSMGCLPTTVTTARDRWLEAARRRDERAMVSAASAGGEVVSVGAVGRAGRAMLEPSEDHLRADAPDAADRPAAVDVLEGAAPPRRQPAGRRASDAPPLGDAAKTVVIGVDDHPRLACELHAEESARSSPRLHPSLQREGERFFGTARHAWSHSRISPNSTTRDRALSAFMRSFNRRRAQSPAAPDLPSPSSSTSAGGTPRSARAPGRRAGRARRGGLRRSPRHLRPPAAGPTSRDTAAVRLPRHRDRRDMRGSTS